jgi:2-oxoisovalerate dehydrogenase E1 component
MPLPNLDWQAVARTVLYSREIDRIEEEELVPGGLVKYQFTARGHDMAQVLLGQMLDHPRDAAGVYYRSRPFVLTAGLTPEEAISATMGRSGAPNGGRDIGVVFSQPPRGRVTILPMSGAVGAQYTPALGWAHGIRYRSETLGESDWQGAIAVALGGDGSCATPGFWSALNIATTCRLPYLFYIEDNGYAISVERRFQTPGSHIADNLASFQGLQLFDGDGTDPAEAARLIAHAVGSIRAGEGPVLLHLSVPRLSGHSYRDNQAYKSAELLAEEQARDPLPKLRDFLVPELMEEEAWVALEAEAKVEVRSAAERAAGQPEGDPESALRFVFSEPGAEALQQVGGARPEGAGLPLDFSQAPAPPTPERKNMVDTIRMALESEMHRSPRLLVFGEDVGAKGGVHGATMDMQLHFGEARVFDTALSEEGIIGRAVGLAYTGLIPVPEIQFRKYADPATEQLNDCGTVRWRTNGRFAAPIIVRMPVGFSPATGDPWHSVSDESILAHSVGWQVVMPADAEEAAGLLRTALRGDDPVYFLEHRALYFGAEARRPYPGDDYMIPFGKARQLTAGGELTVVTWGAMVHRCLAAAEGLEHAVEILDLRTIVPWDKQAVLESVARTGRCLIVHEDHQTAGFGAEIAAIVAEEAFEQLDAPVARLCGPDCPVPYSISMMAGVVPSVEGIRAAMDRQLAY